MARETGPFHKRVARYAQVSGAVAGAGVRLATSGLGADSGVQARAVILRKALGGLKGPLMKIAQILGTIPDLVPPEYAAEFAQLQADAPSMGPAFVRRRMATELGAGWMKRFESFPLQAVAAASLGQVHRATGLDGRVLACKLQYPDMLSAVEADLQQLRLILSLYERYDRAVVMGEVHTELADRLHEELDYAREAKHIGLFRTMLRDVAHVHVPEVVPELSTARLLTMTWLDGEKMSVVAETRSQEERNAIAMNLHRAWYTPFYDCGIIHGDPHLGNYTVRADNSINLLDFGCVRVFPPTLVEGVIRLYRALLSNDEEATVDAYKAWGFINPTKELVSILNVWARFVYAPLLQDRAYALAETNTGVYGRETANKVHAELRKIGGVTVPRAFVFMDRAAIGLGSVFLRLRAEVNWYRLFNATIDSFDVKNLAAQQARLLKKAGL